MPDEGSCSEFPKVEDVNAAIRKHIKPETLTVFAAGDFAKAAAKPATPPTASGH